jgi:coenzyme F420-reducing hydrogenase delta subunit
MDGRVDSEMNSGMETVIPFEPSIAGFFCHTCCGGGEDHGQLDRERLPANLKSLKFICASMVEPAHLQDAFSHGMDGILICGCLVGNCLNSNENCDVLRSIHQATSAVKGMGIHPDRIRREWVCIPGGDTYEGALGDFVEVIRELGPIRKTEKLKSSVEV